MSAEWYWDSGTTRRKMPIGKMLASTLGLHDDDDGGQWDSYIIWEGDQTTVTSAEWGHLILEAPLPTRALVVLPLVLRE